MHHCPWALYTEDIMCILELRLYLQCFAICISELTFVHFDKSYLVSLRIENLARNTKKNSLPQRQTHPENKLHKQRV